MDPAAIGQHIRNIRQGKDLSLNALAERSGLSKGYLSKLENGHAQAPIATLMTLAKALNVSINQVFDGQAKNGSTTAVLTSAKDRELISASEERPYELERLAVGSPFTLTPYIIHLDAETEQDKTYQHEGEEIIFMLNGSCDYRVGDQVYRLKKGDTLTFNAQEPHGAIGIPGKKASYLAIFSDH